MEQLNIFDFYTERKCENQEKAEYLVSQPTQDYGLSKKWKIRSSGDLGNELIKNARGRKQEFFTAIYLDTQMCVICVRDVFKGTLNESVAHPRELFKGAIEVGASSVIVSHNHPSGNPTPSLPDNKITNCLVKAGSIIGIPVIDHIVVGDVAYYSYREHGKIK